MHRAGKKEKEAEKSWEAFEENHCGGLLDPALCVLAEARYSPTLDTLREELLEALPDAQWFEYEPTWKQIAEGRLSGGLKRIDILLRYEDDFGINAAIATSLEQLGFKIGGEFQKHEKTSWKFHGSFQ